MATMLECESNGYSWLFASPRRGFSESALGREQEISKTLKINAFIQQR
jgi:hypothetical protein